MQTNNTNKKGDYWFLDRSRRATIGLRLLLVSLALGVAAVGAACGAGYGDTFQEQYAAANGDDARGTSGLLDSALTTTTNTVDTTISTVGTTVETTTNSSKWYFDCAVVPVNPARCPFSVNIDGTNFGLGSSKVFDRVDMFYSDRSKDGFNLNSNSFKARLRSGKSLDGFSARLKSDGSKWFFDNGKWFIDVDSSRWYGDVDNASFSFNK